MNYNFEADGDRPTLSISPSIDIEFIDFDLSKETTIPDGKELISFHLHSAEVWVENSKFPCLSNWCGAEAPPLLINLINKDEALLAQAIETCRLFFALREDG